MKTPLLLSHSLCEKQLASGIKNTRKTVRNHSRHLLLFACFFALAFSLKAQLSGSYTIDPSKSASKTNYQDFHSAVCDLDSGVRYDGGTPNGKGVSKAVLITVANGTYNEQVTITDIPGSSNANTITFTTTDSSSTKVILESKFTSSSTLNPYVLNISGASHIRFVWMEILALSSGTASKSPVSIVLLQHAVNDFILSHCHIVNSGSAFGTGVYSNLDLNASDSAKQIINNNFYSTTTSIYLTTQGGKYLKSLDKNTVINNNMMDSNSNAFLAGYYQYAISVTNNSLLLPMIKTALGQNAVYLHGATGALNISYNKIQGTATGISLDSCFGSAASPGLIYNNTIYGGRYGILVNYSQYQNMYYNNIYASSSNWDPTCVHIGGYSQKIVFVNNSLQVVKTSKQRAACIILDSGYNVSQCDYNNYYATDSIALMATTRVATLLSWQSMTGLDKHSISVNPTYNLSANIKTGNSALSGMATPVSNISSDITGASRNKTTPTIGAYELALVFKVKASFNYAVSGQCSDSSVLVKFTDSSYTNNKADSITKWTWDFGNGTGSSKRNPTVSYNKVALYSMKLTVTDVYGNKDSLTITLLTKLAPVAKFTAVAGCAGQNSSFTDLSYDPNTKIGSWYWNFGDSSTSTSYATIVTHTYKNAGTYTVSLLVTNGLGCSASYSLKIKVVNSPKPYITSPASWCVGDSVHFNGGDSVGNSTSFLWSFGDGDSSGSKNPVHKYANAGTYKLTLTTSNGSCSSAATQSIVITKPIKINLSYDSVKCSGDSIYFAASDLNSGKNLVYRWNFGDGGTYSSSASSVAHSYKNAGIYKVALNVSNAIGCADNYSGSVRILNHPLPYITAPATWCFGDSVHFTGGDSIGNSYSYVWSFGDGDSSVLKNPSHLYAAAGNYKITLTTSNGSCVTSTSWNLTISKPVSIVLNSDSITCLGDSLTFDGTDANNGTNLSYHWNFGDGSSSSTQKTNHTYAKAGYYVATFSIKNSCGSVSSDSIKVLIDSACVWPGDANYNKKVTIKDILPIGVAYGKTGAARPNASINWTAQPAYDWGKTFKSGHNYKHADCNGDGIVDSTDLKAIVANYGKTHPKTSQAAAGDPSDPPLTVTFSKDSAQAGDTVIAVINLGSASIKASNIYGIALSINYSGYKVQPKLIMPDFTTSWLGTIHKDMLGLMIVDSSTNSIDIGLSRTDQKNVSGYGQIGTVSIMMPDNIAGKTEVKEFVHFEITDYQCISANEASVPLNPITDSILVYQYKNGIAPGYGNQSGGIIIYPNPTTNNLNIKSDHAMIQQIVVTDITGKTVMTVKTTNVASASVNTEALHKGMYYINLKTDKGEVRSRFVKE